MDKIRNKKDIVKDPVFRKKFKENQSIMFDLFDEFIL